MQILRDFIFPLSGVIHLEGGFLYPHTESYIHLKEKYKDFLYIEGMPENKKNVPFYEKHGFSVMKNGAAIQICNYSNVH